MKKAKYLITKLITTIAFVFACAFIVKSSMVNVYCATGDVWGVDIATSKRGSLYDAIDGIYAINVSDLNELISENYMEEKDGKYYATRMPFTLPLSDFQVNYDVNDIDDVNGQIDVMTKRWFESMMSLYDIDGATLIINVYDSYDRENLLQTRYAYIDIEGSKEGSIQGERDEFQERISTSEFYKKAINSATMDYQSMLEKYNKSSKDFSSDVIDSLTNDIQDCFRQIRSNIACDDGDVKGRIFEFAFSCATSKELTLSLIELATDKIATSGNGDPFVYEDVKAYSEGSKSADEIVNSIVNYLISSDIGVKQAQTLGATPQVYNSLYDFYVGVVGVYKYNAVGIEDVGGIGSSFGKAFLNILSVTGSSLVEDVSKTIAYHIAWGIVDVLSMADESITNFSPSIDKFMEYFGGLSVTTSQTTLFSLNKLFFYLGGVLCVVIFLVTLLKVIINPENLNDETRRRETLEIFTRFVLCLIGVMMGYRIMDFIYGLSQDVWNWCFTEAGKNLAPVGIDSYVLYKTCTMVTYNYFGIEWQYDVIGVLFNICIGFVLLKNVFTLFTEVIERYVVSCMLYFSFPTAVSMGASKSTENVFISYMRMLIVQIFMLFMNLYFIAGFKILLMNIPSWGQSLYGVIFVIAYLKVAQAFDSYLNSLGLSVAHTSGAVGRELLGAGATAMTGALMLGRALKTAGNIGTKGIGIGMSSASVMSGKNNAITQRLFNMGENLRTKGMAGIFSGGRMNSQTAGSLATAQANIGKRNSLFTNALSGNIPYTSFNNRVSSDDLINKMLGAKQGQAGEHLSNASMGREGVINGVSKGGNAIAMSNSIEKLAPLSNRASHSSVRSLGTCESDNSTRMFGVMDYSGYNHVGMAGQSAKLNPTEYAGLHHEMPNGKTAYALTNAETTLGFDLAKTEVGRSILNGDYGECTFTVQSNGGILAESESYGKIGYFARGGSSFYEDGYSPVKEIAEHDVAEFNRVYGGEIGNPCIAFIPKEAIEEYPELFDSITWGITCNAQGEIDSNIVDALNSDRTEEMSKALEEYNSIIEAWRNSDVYKQGASRCENLNEIAWSTTDDGTLVWETETYKQLERDLELCAKHCGFEYADAQSTQVLFEVLAMPKEDANIAVIYNRETDEMNFLDGHNKNLCEVDLRSADKSDVTFEQIKKVTQK